jgi:rubrerythrin
MHDPVDTLEAFYAYALAMESEAAERYREFARHFASRGEPLLCALCDMLAKMEAGHHAELSRAAEAVVAPVPEPQAGRSGDAAESGPREAFYRIRNPEQLLLIALDGELRAQRFFEWAARASPDPAVRSLATQMAREEARHVGWISDAIALHRPLRA